MRYGYRVHTLELARGLRGRILLDNRSCTNEREREAFRKGKGDDFPRRDYLDVLTQQLAHLRDREDTLTDIPKLIAVADGANEFVPGDEPGTPRLTVEDFRVSGRRVSVDVEYGHLGWHHRAVGEKRTDNADLKRRSPMQIYRIEFVLPDSGTCGLVASETISGGHALPMLTAWLNQLAREAETDDGMVRLMTHPLTDLQQVLRLLERPNSVAEIELQRPAGAPTGTKDGAPTSSGKIILKEQLVPGSKLDGIKILLERWHEARFEYSGEEAREQVRALAELVDPSAGGLEFTDGVIRLDPDGGKKVSVRPTKLGELYAFEISDTVPPPNRWSDEVKSKISAFAKDLELSVVWS